MNFERRLQQLLMACVACLWASMAVAGEASSGINPERGRVSIIAVGAAPVEWLRGLFAGVSSRVTEQSFDFGAERPQTRRWVLDVAIRSVDESSRTAVPHRLGEFATFTSAMSPVGEPRGNELLLRARYDF
jgi:hypothetical protein